MTLSFPKRHMSEGANVNSGELMQVSPATTHTWHFRKECLHTTGITHTIASSEATFLYCISVKSQVQTIHFLESFIL